MNFSDKISTWVGAPPNTWKDGEKAQMKKIQNAYKVAYTGDHDTRLANRKDTSATSLHMREQEVEVEETGSTNSKDEENEKQGKMKVMVKDDEFFLPENSPLRSKDSGMKQPANTPFKDYDTFLNSCNFDYWQHYFDKSTGDQKMIESARALLANICLVQSKNQLRVKKGAVPFRKRREHITPLALCLHEIKDWCVTTLRSADPNVEDTFREIRKRIVYLEGIAAKEVWGNAALLFGQGISMTGHDKLFRMLNTGRNLLEEAENYAYRKFCGRSSRETLYDLNHKIQRLINREMRVLSGRFELERKLSDPKTSKLNPALLLQRVEDMQTIDFKNPVNVLLFKMFQNAFVKACFNSHFESSEVKQIIASLGDWSDGNLFCRKGANEPIFLFEKSKGAKFMPQIYKPTAAELKVLIRKVDTRTPVPDPVKKVVERLLKAFENIDVVAEIMKSLMKTLAAIQELIPCLYAVHKLYELAGEGGNFTIYDNMRDNVVQLMTNTLERIHTLRKASRSLSKKINKRCAEKEKEIKKLQMKKGKSIYKPSWVNNHRYISTQMENKSGRAYEDCTKVLNEIAKTARDYTLTSDELSDKVNETKDMIDTLIGISKTRVAVTPEEDEVPLVAPPNKAGSSKDKYLDSKSPLMDSDDESEMEFGANNNFGDKSNYKKSKTPVMYDDSDDDSM